MNADAPIVSVIVPAWRSGETIRASLESILTQTFRDFEVIVVESSGDVDTASMIAREFPSVKCVQSPVRLLPQAARNRGVAEARGGLLVFTDPDIYVSEEWLATLVAGWQECGEVVIGSFACFGSSIRDFGFHLTKFSKWLPAGAWREVDNAPSGNMLVSRAHFQSVGGFREELFIGDVELSRCLRERGVRLWFEPKAVVAHHHLYDVREFCAERYQRGRWYGELRASWCERRRWRIAYLLLVTVLPLRLFSNLLLVVKQAVRAGEAVRLIAAFPVLVAGYAATLAGEARAYAAALGRLRL
jgi:GT2 family glycosyltransferase